MQEDMNMSMLAGHNKHIIFLAFQVVMQPESHLRQKLAQLPHPALEALLDSPDVKAASENTVIAAVTFWLEQVRPEMLTKEQKQSLAYKLRLLRATPWYLTRIVLKEGHWLHDILSSDQKIVLAAAVHNQADWGDLQAIGSDVLNAKLFGRDDLVGFCWWDKGRPLSSIRRAEVYVEVSPQNVWDKRGGSVALSKTSFYNGLLWTLDVHFTRAGASNAPGGYQIGAFMQHSSSNEPLAFTASYELVGVAQKDTKRKQLGRMVIWKSLADWGYKDLVGTMYTSLEDATAKLGPFIHPDGKLHITGTVTGVY
jgi:hypothetical protein